LSKSAIFSLGVAANEIATRVREFMDMAKETISGGETMGTSTTPVRPPFPAVHSRQCDAKGSPRRRCLEYSRSCKGSSGMRDRRLIDVRTVWQGDRGRDLLDVHDPHHGPERSIPRYNLVLNNSLRYLRRYAPCMPRLVMPPIACDTVQLAFLRTSTTASDVVESPNL
jgi:hypothetical protein